ncbi:MAG: chemotaxis protein CheW [Proteobacteria bacterium]|nr:chemotaxis protein CheW [Pseudomonadota bacterium]MDA1023993.1 chemotaxis protein CheW [Pseudomonadota bacterium]
MDDLLSEFLTETGEALAVLDLELIKFEQDPTDSEILGNIFRLVHTIKGTCGFLGLPRLESVAHAGENVLGKFRDGVVDVTPAAVTLILKCLDTIRDLLGKLEETGEEPEGEDGALISELNAMADGEAAPPPVAPLEDVASAPAAETPPASEQATLSDEEITLVQETFKKVEPNAAGIAEMFYARLFETRPDLKDLFKGDMQEQGEHLMAMIKTAVEGLNDLEAIVPALEDLGRRHVDYGVKDEDYDSVGEALLWTLEKGFGDEFTAEVKSAWTKVYTLLASVMTAAAGGAEDTPPSNEFGAPVAQDLLDEVLAAEAEGIKGASQAQMDAEMAAEREAEKPKSAPPAAPEPSVPAKAEEKAPAKTPKEAPVVQASIRVNVDVLEDLMTQVSELVLTRNQLMQLVRGRDKDDELTGPLQRLSHITSDLQEGVMKTRMQPIGNAWAKLPRIVRDLAIEQGKQIELEMLGADTELDRQVLELIKDPLTHMVRNSADHGLEMPDGRIETGKSEKGTIVLKAYHEGGHIIIQISDDGRGLNMERIRAKCLENGLLTEAELADMPDLQIQQYIFAAGFSTAEKITSISGRGVGMDVVRTNIEKIGGTVELKSVAGKGSTFTIKIPLTLAIVSALIVECAKERFAIPQISVLELVRASEKSDNAVEMINQTPVLRLRNRLLPLVSLKNLLELNDPSELLIEETPQEAEVRAKIESIAAAAADSGRPVKESSKDDEMFIVVTQVGATTFGIIVDQVFDTEEIVVKPVAPVLRDISFYSGNTILGDGSVIMILDPNGIAQAGGQMSAEEMDADEEAPQVLGQEGEVTSLLIFRAGGDDLKAVPLALIARLEEIDMAVAERSHNQVMVQYRGHLMPLIPCDPGHEFKTKGRQPVLVFTDDDHSLGLVVDEIVDIVEERLKIELASDLPGLIGSAVIDGKATDLVDAGYFLTQGFPDWFGSSSQGAFTNIDGSRRALLVDDSPFFRNLLSPLLSVAGWNVITAASADQALQMREQGMKFDVIISDIEMPGMNGFDLAKDVRGDPRWKDVPMIALSGRSSDDDLQRGREAGFNDYVAKFDREALVGGLAQTVATATKDRQNSLVAAAE